MTTTNPEQLRAFIERIERLEAEKKDIADQIKEVKAEAKGQGYDVSVITAIVRRRKKSRDDVAEQDAILELYETALGA